MAGGLAGSSSTFQPMDIEHNPDPEGKYQLSAKRMYMATISILGICVAVLMVGILAVMAAPKSKSSSGCHTVSSSSSSGAASSDVKPKSIIFFISDGMGPGYYTMARDSAICGELAFEPHLMGLSKTRSADSLVTDSAAGATAYATGYKTNNHVVGEVPVTDLSGEGAGVAGTSAKAAGVLRPVGTILEGAQLAGKYTGLVTTTRITHATPASFSSHVASRDDENEIAHQQVMSLEVNVLLGGGRQHFDPQSVPGSKRTDDLDLIARARSRGYKLATDLGSMKLMAAELKADTAAYFASNNHWLGPRLLGLFDASHLPYEIDFHGGFGAKSGEADVHGSGDPPALEDMTQAALDVLSVGTNGFFLMVEAGRIDHGGHANDAGAALAEVCAYNRAFKKALAFAEAHPEVLIVATSDHDTGGLSVGCCGKYALNITELKKLTASAEAVTTRIITAYKAATNAAAQGPALMAGLLAAAGRDPASGDVSGADLSTLHAMALKASAEGGGHGYEGYDLQNKVGEVLNNPNLIGFTSHGHTGVDVPLFAYGASSARFKGFMDNTEVGRTMVELLGVDPAMGYEAFKERMAFDEPMPPPPSPPPRAPSL